MPSTQPSSDEWDDDAIKTLLEYGGWELRWFDDESQWIAVPANSEFGVGVLFGTLKEVYEYYLNYMKWWHDYPKTDA